MATMTASAREAMILGYGENRYRLPTVREAACMMSFPIDYWFYGESRGVKHTLVGNAVPPKLSYAVAIAIANAANEPIPAEYIPIQHAPDDEQPPFVNLNGAEFEIREEQPKRETSKFKYHIPYLILDAYRVELTNYRSDFQTGQYIWETEIHYSQGKDKARVYKPNITMRVIPHQHKISVQNYIEQVKKAIPNMNAFQTVFCMTTKDRGRQKYYGPYELLESVKAFIETTFTPEEQKEYVRFGDEPASLPLAIATGYLILNRVVTHMGRLQ